MDPRPLLDDEAAIEKALVGKTPIATSSKKKKKQKGAPRIRFLWIIALLGIPVNLGWCVGESMLVPHLLTLGAPTYVASCIWLINPILGIFLQPYFGSLSDRCRSRLGKRRPFIIAFGVMAVAGMLGVIYATELQQLLFPQDDNNIFAISLIFVCFAMMDLSHDSLVTPSRTLMMDLAGEERLNHAMSLISLYSNIGRCVGLVIAALPIENIEPFKLAGTHLKAVFWCTAILSAGITLLVCLYAKEIPHLPPRRPKRASTQPARKATSKDDEWQQRLQLIPEDEVGPMEEQAAAEHDLLVNIAEGTGMQQEWESDLEEKGSLTPHTLHNNSPISVEGSQEEEEEVEEEEESDSMEEGDESDSEEYQPPSLLHTRAMKGRRIGDAGYTSAADTEPEDNDSHSQRYSTRSSQSFVSVMDSPIPAGGNENPSEEEEPSLRQVLSTLCHLPPRVRKLWTISFAGWFTYNMLSFFWTAFVAVEVFHGTPTVHKTGHARALMDGVVPSPLLGASALSPSYIEHLWEAQLVAEGQVTSLNHGDPVAVTVEGSKEFAEGVMWGTLCLAVQSLASALFSTGLTWLNKKFGVHWVFYVGEFSAHGLVLLLIIPSVSSKWGVMIISFALSVFTATHSSNPYVILEDLVEPHERGLYVSALNLSMVVAQILVSLFAFALSTFLSNLRVLLASSAGVGLVLTLAVFFFCPRKQRNANIQLAVTNKAAAAKQKQRSSSS